MRSENLKKLQYSLSVKIIYTEKKSRTLAEREDFKPEIAINFLMNKARLQIANENYEEKNENIYKYESSYIDRYGQQYK